MSRAAVFAALSLAVVAASARALGGGWVYDDRLMVGHPLMDGVEDLLPTFARNSADYMNVGAEPPRGAIAGSPTYRPVSMLTLVLVNATVGPRPLVHHLVSLALHLATLWLLCGLAARARRISLAAAVLLGAFALHPALTEATLWINGRADALAGLMLVLAARICLASPARSPAREGPILFAVLLAGALAKETFLVAAAALLVASFVQSPEPPTKRRILVRGAALTAATAGLLLARSATLPASPGAGDVTPGLAGLIGYAPRLVALAVETLAIPLPRPMRLLAWELSRPWSVARLFGCLGAAAFLAMVMRRRSWRALALASGAIGALLPAALVANSFWLGFDRYLYLPACLLAVASLPAAAEVAAPTAPATRRWLAVGGGALLLVLALGTATSAGAYRSQTAFCVALVEKRPDDPTGAILAAEDALAHGDRALASQLFDRIRADDLPAPVAHAAATTALTLGRLPALAAIVESAGRRFPNDPNAAFDVLTLRLAQGRWTDAAALAATLSRDPSRRAAVDDLLKSWLASGRVPPEGRTLLESIDGVSIRP